MIDEHLEEAASLYVLDLLEADELRRFEGKLENDPELRATVDEMRAAAALLAHGAPLRKPPASLESRIFAEIKKEQRPVAFRTASNWIPWALAACLTIACVLLIADRARVGKKLAQLETRDAMAQMQIATLSSKLENAPNAVAVVLWDSEKQEGVLKVADVPRNSRDRDYQLWIIDPKRKLPVNGGVFGVDEKGATKISFKPESPITSAQAFAISLERKGGVPKAEGPIVLMSK
ncbi:MAG: anti-sigma factor [Verrucomicrobiota bacterium]